MALIVAAWFALVLGAVPAASQDEATPWSDPVNLSQTGGTSDPRLVTAPSGLRHVVWDVTFADSAYSFGDGEQWGNPTSIEVPFKDRPATLLPDRNGDVHAFWVDDEGSLFHKTVPGNSLSSSASWFGGPRLATSVAAFSAALDDQGRLHVGLIRADDTPSLPAGVYYMASRPGGQGWSLPRRLYESNYYQQFRPSGGPDAAALSPEADLPAIHLETETDESTTHLYLSWDNPAVKRVFQAVSDDSGASWAEVEEVDGPSASAPYDTPRDLRVFSLGENAIRTWKVVTQGGSCAQRSQASGDGGKTWSETRPGLGGVDGCPQHLQSFLLDEGMRLFLSELGGQISLVAWDGSAWSAPQPQPELEFFVNPETYEFVDLGCRQAGLSDGVLVVVGCDQGSGGDTWVTERPVDDVAGWFDADQGWTSATVTLEEDVTPRSLGVISDLEGRTHVLWMEPNNGADPQTGIRYIGLEAGAPIGPFDILPDLAGSLNSLDLALSPEGRLLAVWADGQSGDIELGWTVVGQADSASSWFTATSLPSMAFASRQPSIVAEEGGRIYVAYTVPVNEQRGVYLVASEDFGKTWSDPKQIFDGPGSDCELVEASQLALAPSGELHVVWSCSTQPGGAGPVALRYAHSTDSGLTWSPSDTMADSAPTWSQLLALPSGEIHLIWEERRLGRTYTYHRWLAGDGETWSDAEALVSIGGEDGATAVMADSLGQIYLLQVAQESSEPPLIRTTVWDGAAWRAGRSLELAAEDIRQVVDLRAAIDADHRLVAAVAQRSGPNPSGSRPYEILLASIPALPGDRSAVAGLPSTSRATPTSEATPTRVALTAAPVPTLEFSKQVTGGPSGGLAVGLAAALVSTVILLGVALAQRFRRSPDDSHHDQPSDQAE